MSESFIQPIRSVMKQVTVFMNESLNHWLTRFIQTPDSFRNEANYCLYEWVIESLTHLIHSNAWFIQKQSKWLSLWMSHIDSLDSFKWLTHSETKANYCLYEWVIESLTHLIHSNAWFIQKLSKWLSLWMSLWFIDSLDSFKRLIHSETKQVTVFMNESLNHWLTRFIQTPDSFRNEASDCLYEWVNESLTHFIHSNTWFIKKWSKWLFMNESLNHWLTRFIQTPGSFRNKASDCLYEWVFESLTHSIHSNAWFIQKQSKWLSLWMSHWIIDSLDSFKRLIHSETKQVTVFMNESLNHWLTWFIQTPDSFRNEASHCLYEWVNESLTH